MKIKYTENDRLRTLDEVKAFFEYLVKDLSVSFNPDESFHETIDYKTGEPTFSDADADILDNLMNDASGVCASEGKDIYELSWEVLRKADAFKSTTNQGDYNDKIDWEGNGVETESKDEENEEEKKEKVTETELGHPDDPLVAIEDVADALNSLGMAIDMELSKFTNSDLGDSLWTWAKKLEEAAKKMIKIRSQKSESTVPRNEDNDFYTWIQPDMIEKIGEVIYKLGTTPDADFSKESVKPYLDEIMKILKSGEVGN